MVFGAKARNLIAPTGGAWTELHRRDAPHRS
jgi:hypothetical protein